MKILIAILMALGLTLGLGTPSAQAADAIEVRMKPIVVHQSPNHGVAHSINVQWNYGWPYRDARPRSAWAAPRFVTVKTDRYGTSEGCGVWDGYAGTDVRVTIRHPFSGRVWKSSWIDMPCQHDTTNTATISLFKSGRWLYSGGMYPRFYPRFELEYHDRWDVAKDTWGKIGPKLFWRP